MPEDTMIGRYLAARKTAQNRGDAGLVRECDFQLARIGYRPEATAAEREVAEHRADTNATPTRATPQTRRTKSTSDG